MSAVQAFRCSDENKSYLRFVEVKAGEEEEAKEASEKDGQRSSRGKKRRKKFVNKMVEVKVKKRREITFAYIFFLAWNKISSRKQAS